MTQPVKVAAAHPLTCCDAFSAPSAVEKARHCRPDAAAFALVNPHDRIFGPHRVPERILSTASASRDGAL
jgi:hypothetical protein